MVLWSVGFPKFCRVGYVTQGSVEQAMWHRVQKSRLCVTEFFQRLNFECEICGTTDHCHFVTMNEWLLQHLWLICSVDYISNLDTRGYSPVFMAAPNIIFGVLRKKSEWWKVHGQRGCRMVHTNSYHLRSFHTVGLHDTRSSTTFSTKSPSVVTILFTMSFKATPQYFRGSNISVKVTVTCDWEWWTFVEVINTEGRLPIYADWDDVINWFEVIFIITLKTKVI